MLFLHQSSHHFVAAACTTFRVQRVLNRYVAAAALRKDHSFFLSLSFCGHNSYPSAGCSRTTSNGHLCCCKMVVLDAGYNVMCWECGQYTSHPPMALDSDLANHVVLSRTHKLQRYVYTRITSREGIGQSRVIGSPAWDVSYPTALLEMFHGATSGDFRQPLSQSLQKLRTPSLLCSVASQTCLLKQRQVQWHPRCQSRHVAWSLFWASSIGSLSTSFDIRRKRSRCLHDSLRSLASTQQGLKHPSG